VPITSSTAAFRAAVLAVLASLLAALAAVPATAESPAPPAGGSTFTVGVLQDADSLNPFTGFSATAYEVYQLVYDSLIGYSNEDFGPAPRLAQSWEESEDGLTWTYELVPDATWHDGEPVTAEDAAYTIQRIVDGTYEQTNWGSYVANVERAEAVDEDTLEIHLTEPTPIMGRLAVPILPEHVWENIGPDEVSSFANDPGEAPVVGSGPFVLEEHQPGQFIRLSAYEDYWGGAPSFDELVFRIYGTPDALAQALRSGEIDFAEGLVTNTFDALEDAEGIDTVAGAYPIFNQITINTGAALADGTQIGDGHEALTDVRVRQAINYAIDRQALVDRVLGGYGVPGTTIIPPLYGDLHWDPGDEAYTYDPEEAARLLDEAGWTEGDDGVREGPDGQRLSLRLLGRTESTESAQTVEFVGEWLEDVGIEITVELVSEDVMTERLGQGDFDLSEWNWIVEPDPDYMLSVFTCDNRSYEEDGTVYANLSDSFFCDPEFDELYAEQAVETDPDERAAIVHEMQQILHEAAPYAVTYHSRNLEAYDSDRLSDLVPQPAPDGALLFAYGIDSYTEMSLDAAEGGEGGSATALIVLALVVALAVVAFVVLRMRRRATAGDRA
jgi:peptide/nickel transport system substrate-binding protein